MSDRETEEKKGQVIPAELFCLAVSYNQLTGTSYNIAGEYTHAMP